MKTLNRMLFREIGKTRGQFIAAAVVIFAGITMFAACYLSYRNLKNSMDYYYESYRFLDYYADASDITTETVKKVRELDGIKYAAGRICKDISADMGGEKRVTLRMISVPDGTRPTVNDVFVMSGGYLDASRQNSCLIDQKFAEYHQLGKGDTIKVILGAKAYEFKINGAAASPEFIYALKSSASISPSAENFGILYVNESAAAGLLGFEGIYNQLHVVFDKDANRKNVINSVERILKPSGFISGTERKDQLSHIMFDSEVKQYEQIAYMFPALFLTVAALIIYVMLRRMISNQRIMIGSMKAFGYTNVRLLKHYGGYSVLIALIGAVPAVFAGIYLGKLITSMYNDIFSIPVMQFKTYWEVLLIGVFMSIGFCLLAGCSSARQVFGIMPSQAMRPETPGKGRHILLEKSKLIWGRLPFGWKMSIRNVFRNPQRTALTILGMVFTVMFFMVSLFFLDSIDFILTQHFVEFQRQDYKVVFNKPASYEDTLELNSIEGVARVEPICELPIEIKKGWRKVDTLLVGLSGKNTFYRLENQNLKPVGIPEKGILVAHVTAEKLNLMTGDLIVIKPYIGTAKERKIRVAGIVKQYVGFSAFMSMEQAAGVLGEEIFATGALLTVENGRDAEIKRSLFKNPAVESIENRNAAFLSFKTFMAMMYLFVTIMIVFGCIMGFAIIFNTTVINIMERRRELASLKVLGYSAREIERTIYRENLMLGVSALPPGVILGYAMCALLGRMFSNQVFAMEVVIYPRTFLITFSSIFIFILLAVKTNSRNISGLDMVEVLKNREG